MAENKIILSLEIDGVTRNFQSIKDIKQGVKDLKNELATLDVGSEAFKKASKNLNELQGKLGDVGDAAKIEGNSFERLGKSASLIGEGFQTFDADKIKLGFQGIGGAMKAIPIFLLISGITLLITNFGEIVKWGKEFFNIMSDDERAVRALTKEMNTQKEVTAQLIKELTRELELMQAKGASDGELLAKKKELIKTQLDEAVTIAKVNFAKLKQAEADATYFESTLIYQSAILRKIGQDEAADKIDRAIHASKIERTKEQRKALSDSQELIKDLTAKGISERLSFEKKEKDKQDEINKKNREDDITNAKEHQKKLADETEAVRKKFADEHGIKAMQERLKEREAFLQAEEDAEKKLEKERYERMLEMREQEHQADIIKNAQLVADDKLAKETLIKNEQDLFNAKVSLANASIGIISSLQGFVAKGSAASKALALTEIAAQTGVGLIQGLIVAQKAAAGTGPAAAIAFPIFLATQIGAVLAAALKAKAALSGGASAPSAPAPPTIPSLPSTSSNAPVVRNEANAPTNESTTFDRSGNRTEPLVVKAVVVETDITDAQRRVNRLKEQSTY